jgi:hypothetical protein
VPFCGCGGDGGGDGDGSTQEVLSPPATPSDLVATPLSSSYIRLSWQDNSTDEDGFQIERSLDGANWQLIQIIGNYTVGRDVTSFDDVGLSAQTTYYYRVRAGNSTGYSQEWSNIAFATTQAVITNPPQAPSGLTATAVSLSQIDLSWADNSTTEDGFVIQRREGLEGSWTVVAVEPANTTSYSDTGLSAQRTYYYRIYAYNSAGNSSYSNESSATTFGSSPSAPAAPTELTAQASSIYLVELRWRDNSTDEEGFKIERKDSADGTYVEIATTLANVESYLDESVSPGTTYYYRVCAFSSGLYSSYSSAEVTTPLAPSPYLAGSYNTPGWAFGVCAREDRVYIADDDGGLQITDLSGNFIGSCATPAGFYDGAQDVDLSGNYAYVANLSTGLQVIDLSTLQIAGSCDTPGYAYGICLSGGYAYVADFEAGLRIIDISSLQIVGFYDTPGEAMDVFVVGSYAYIADGDAGGLQIVDISNPTNPSFVGACDTTGRASGVYVLGDYAYIADGSKGLKIIDVSDPSDPFLVGSIYTGYSQGVFVEGNYAYVAGGTQGLQIVYIRNPSTPRIVSSYKTYSATDVFILGDYAYLADDEEGLKIIGGIR